MVDSEDVFSLLPIVVFTLVVVLGVLAISTAVGITPFPEYDGTSTTGPPQESDADGLEPRTTTVTTSRTNQETVTATTTPQPEETIDLTFTSPTGSYVTGTEAVVEGTASPSVGSVAIYVQTGDSWEQLDVTSDGDVNDSDVIRVADDGTWRKTVLLSSIGSVLQTPGRYALAVVPMEGVGNGSGIRQQVSNETLGNLTAGRTILVVQPPAQPAQSPPPATGPSAFLTVNGQVATEDNRVAVRGTARGAEEVLVFFVGPGGGFSSTTLQVGDDDTFEKNDVSLTTFQERRLKTGVVVSGVYSVGRDGQVGDGEFRGLTRSDLDNLDPSDIGSIDAFIRATIRNRVQGLQGPGLTQQQVLEFLTYETVGAPGSDDLLIQDVFLFTSGRTTIENVGLASETNTMAPQTTVASPPRFAPGETMVVRGLTNRQPDNTIVVEVTEGPSSGLFEVAMTSEWGRDGVWSVEIQVPPGAKPGTYTVRSDDSDYLDTVQVEIRPENATARGRTTSNPRTGPPAHKRPPTTLTPSPTRARP